jgi:hypothetical protein
MTSTIKVDTISEKTSANGVAVDGVTLKDGAVDVQGVSDGIILDADGDTTISADTDDQIDFKAGGTDTMHIINGKVGIGTTSPSTDLHIFSTADNAPHLLLENFQNADTDDAPVIELYLNDQTTGGIGDNTDVGVIRFTGDEKDSGTKETYAEIRGVAHDPGSGSGNRGGISFFAQSAGSLAETMTLDEDKVGIGEVSPDCDGGGLTLNQGANDAKIFTLKSSDIAHGMTGSCETDTFGLFTKADANKGGMQIRAFAEDAASERLNINVQGEGDVTEATSTSTRGALHFISSNKSGTGQAAQNANGNILSLANYITTRFLFEGDGNFHADAGSNTYDAYEDAHLARAYDLSHGKGVIESKFDKFVAYNHEKLADLKLVGREEDGTPNHFINVTGMQRLHNGAIWQQYEKHQRLAEAVYEMAKETLGKDKADAILEKHDIKLLN